MLSLTVIRADSSQFSREDKQTTPIEVTTSLSDIADEKQLFFTQADNEKESGEQTLQRKEQSRQDAKEWVANEEPNPLKTCLKEFKKSDVNNTSYSTNGIKTHTG